MKQPRDERSGDEEKQKAAQSVEMHRTPDGVPYAFGGGAVNDSDLAKLASVGCARIDDTRAVLTQDAGVATACGAFAMLSAFSSGEIDGSQEAAVPLTEPGSVFPSRSNQTI